MSKTYGQYCGLARALDLVGDRWSLLIVRELLIAPARFRDLQAGLGSIATNLLTDRLNTLQRAGVIERRTEGARPVYELTPLGAGLREPIEALVRWSTPLMTPGPAEDRADARWLAVALPALLAGKANGDGEEIAIRVDGVDLTLAAGDAGIEAEVRTRSSEREPHRVSMTTALAAAVLSETWSDFRRSIIQGAAI
ncbi:MULTISPECIES: winged helix-turn-helix transcriptional regulator [Nocardioides]|uniref:Winged helix-turn-helix transcriptional regulator n=1 Tax=Nocardioides vastitatis TaxID=2568655 RepID=A0ABW0Z8I6_9ACTN|nr:helix-turn-helix domain-containing protein [Nocardioides sp.]THI96179.1 helix-turn-helix transcriptional regulator [Nocardioides sp.]